MLCEAALVGVCCCCLFVCFAKTHAQLIGVRAADAAVERSARLIGRDAAGRLAVALHR